MPRNRPRMTSKGSWTEDNLRAAVQLTRKESVSVRKAAKQFNIPYSTLRDRIKNGNLSNPKLGRYCVFTTEQEDEIATRINLLADVFYGITPFQLRRAAFNFAERKGIKHNFNNKTRSAGLDWLSGFVKRDASVSLRKPEGTSINRVLAFNREAIKLMFDNLESVMDKHNFSPSNIFNVDESGISTVQETVKILAPKGKKRVGSVTSWERGKNVTVICAVSASGTFIPPMFVFPRKRMAPQLSKDGPLGAIYHCSDNGWSNETLFLVWLQHFAQHSGASEESQVLLILDNHVSHTSLEAYDFCRLNGITMVSLPPHTSHRTQPLDVTFFSPLKDAFKRQSDLFMKNKNSEVTGMKVVTQITPYDLAGIFNKAYLEVAKIGLAVSGFKNTGIFPFNRQIFTDEDFKAADTLVSEGLSPTLGIVVMSSASSPNVDAVLDELLPLPGPAPRKENARPKQKSEILTATPRKLILVEKRKRKMEKGNMKPPKKTTRRQLQLDSNQPTSSSSVGDQKKAKKKGGNDKIALKTKGKGTNRSRIESSDSDDWGDISEEDLVDDTDDDVDCDEFMALPDVDSLCIICQEDDSNSPTWICQRCNHSCHYLCSMGRPDHGLCDICNTV